jgi:hypothetical protein
MTININDLADLGKLLAFLRVGAKGKFAMPAVLSSELIQLVLAWAKKQDITVRFVSPTGQKIAAYSALGAAAGMAVGCIVPPVGPVAGFIIGALGGFALAHVTIELAPAGKDGSAVLTIL